MRADPDNIKKAASFESMRVRISSASYWILLGIAFLHVFFVEDVYGVDNASPSLAYQSFGGLTILDVIIVLLAMAFIAGPGEFRLAGETRWLFLLLGMTLVIAYFVAAIRGSLFWGGQGTGLKELRASVIMCLLYFVFRKTCFNFDRLLGFTRHLGWIILISAVAHLLQYIFGWGSFISPEYGGLTAFEGPLLIWWVFGFSLFLARCLVKTERMLDAGMAIVIAIAILLSFRRTPEFMAILIFAVTLAYGLRRFRKSLLAIALLGMIGLLIVGFWGNKLLPKINPANLFDTNSEEYARNFSSNQQHANDIILGWDLVKQHYVFGVGPGAVLQSPDPGREFAMDTMVHMQYWNFWLRLGVLGLCLLLYFYYIQIKFSMVALGKALDSRSNALALAILGFTLAAASVASLVGLNVYGTAKLEYLTVFIFVAAEMLYLENANNASSTGIRR